MKDKHIKELKEKSQASNTSYIIIISNNKVIYEEGNENKYRFNDLIELLYKMKFI
jgi:hypothetical protein